VWEKKRVSFVIVKGAKEIFIVARKGREQYDWEAIRHEYVSSEMTTKELAEKHGIRVRTVEDRCAKEGWVQQRKDFVARVAERTTIKATEKIAESQSEVLAKVLTCVDVGADKALQLLEGDVSAAALEHIINSLQGIENMARSIQRILTLQQEHKMYIENERLKMDQQRAEAFNPDSEIVIRIEGAKASDVEEWAK